MKKDIPELVKAGVISAETADKIRAFYQEKEGQSNHRLFIVFGILGAILVGLGMVLIIAHNWDELSRMTKTGLAFLPLLLGQGLCGYALLSKQESVAWRESVRPHPSCDGQAPQLPARRSSHCCRTACGVSWRAGSSNRPTTSRRY